MARSKKPRKPYKPPACRVQQLVKGCLSLERTVAGVQPYTDARKAEIAITHRLELQRICTGKGTGHASSPHPYGPHLHPPSPRNRAPGLVLHPDVMGGGAPHQGRATQAHWAAAEGAFHMTTKDEALNRDHPYVRKMIGCGHGRLFSEPCNECEIVALKEEYRRAIRTVQRVRDRLRVLGAPLPGQTSGGHKV